MTNSNATERFCLPWLGSDFKQAFSGHNGRDTMSVRWDNLIEAAITVGRERPDPLQPSHYSAAEMTYRTACIEAHYEIQDGRLVTTPSFAELDKTEKCVISYHLGMALTSVWARQVAGVPWLTHVSKIRPSGRLTTSPLRREPDLLGMRVNLPSPAIAPEPEWLVAEAKGHATVRRTVLKDIRDQKQAVTAIDGKPPWLAVGCIAHPSAKGFGLRVIDPEPDHDGAHWQIGPAKFLASYYAPFVDLMEWDSWVDGDQRVAPLPGTRWQVVIDSDVLERAQMIRSLVDGDLSRRAAGDETIPDEWRIAWGSAPAAWSERENDGIRVVLAE